MQEYNLTPEQEDAFVEQQFRDLLDGYIASNHRKKVEIIERAFRFAKEAHKGVRRRSGEPYIIHPIAVAKIASASGPLQSALRSFTTWWRTRNIPLRT